ncbi:aminotransferase class V-fold PLP-dependent enzyme [Siccirubricoccus sp. KC 17139]|uniref:Aminotransferase class V-fold PLP-dependent enzyme n=1 Tax=Siccirubricoccus soli TaxID=2899147 RepID=A0ABT1D3U1_9PROT|nr:aminotransferase class V-fold PLP-dependent enzyme [Siccirubricoccus soli]MCO6416602.1 aminotransferase class V-fold PLP-dependent enzyme [Siccirubricoccus soli]MCP2682737.1 aminotransferase class V-fold PLP-dependent enzyme [Siccirubricoccus soli]
MTAATPLFDPAEFRIPAGIVHVCAGGETAFLHRHDAALLRYAADKSAGPPGRDAQDAVVRRAREKLAAAWGVEAADLGFCAHVAEGASLVVESLDWREGDNAVVDPDEYPSLVGPLALQRHPRVEVRPVRMRDPAALAAAVDGQTRLIAVSHVSYLTGERYDLVPLRAAADRAGAWLLVDHTQAAGYLPIDPRIADFAFAASYKWQLGMTGTAVAYWNRARQPGWAPSTAGWHSLASMARPDYAAGLPLVPDAMRFCRGNPAHAAVYVLESALDYLAGFPPGAVAAHVQALTTALLAGLAEFGIPSTTPADPARHGASVCIATPDAARLTRALHERGIWAWNGRGRVRFSFHGYNAIPEVGRILEALRAEWRA